MRALKPLIDSESPLVIAGAVNAYSAMLAEHSGIKALYLSGAGVANASFGLPDLGITSLNDVAEDARRITDACALPLLVDIDTGFGGAFQIARTIKAMQSAGVSAVHMEDQVAQKRCGHRPNKEVVSTEEMVDRIKAAVDARTDENFFIMARTDATAIEGVDAAVDRAAAYAEAGADGIFAEAVTDLQQYRLFAKATGVPILANMTEFGKTPQTKAKDFADYDVSMVLYPLSAFRAMSAAALNVYQALSEDAQETVIPSMQTRTELYEHLGYHEYEQKLDELFQSRIIKQ